MGLLFSHECDNDSAVTRRGASSMEEEETGSSRERERVSRQEALRRQKAQFLKALQENDAQELKRLLHTTTIDLDTVFEVEDQNMVLASYKQGYWLPGYKLEKSWAMGIHVCMMYNSLECALLLLERGASLNRMPNGKTPLHVACEVSHGDCVALLLEHGAKTDRVSLSGHVALHYCITKQSLDCARHLLLKGAEVNFVSQNNDEDTPLHTAARFGLAEMATFYLSHGADINKGNARMETPLISAAYWAFCSREQIYSTDHHLVCRILLDHGAQPNLKEEDKKTALHKAAWNADHVLMEMLLTAGADAMAMDVNGCPALQYMIKVTQVRPASIPEVCYQLLLNHGCARVYPLQFHKVLQSCHEFPRAVEVMVNCYEHIKSTRKWKTAISDECYERHKDFYDSMFDVCSNTPRRLTHLARCAIRATLQERCHRGIHQLGLPPPIVRYVLLEPEGVVY
ncbi:ankyrin repeat and SOCS box protein 4 [Engraulis encrasicolus]|uniref:ankyrin repeat and SOCS box protein 4 n=1 Tax=Engraulis encrasicolus TaxID=184585 RepID=UPI002FD647AD